ncbi:MAG TPA: ribosome-associated translation inhibitor RaiA [Micropepsaceae bacterium]|jgi:ribosomal subunit interface protein
MMHIRIAGKQIEIGEALPQQVRERLSETVEKHFDRDATANVTFTKERMGFRADCTVHLSSGASMQAHGIAEHAHAAFGIAREHLEKRVRRYKRRLKNHHDRGGLSPSASL